MRRLLSLPVLLLALTLGAPGAGAGEFRFLGPWGGRIADVERDPSHPARIYAATTNAGVYRSDDEGATWEPARAGLPVDAFVGNHVVIYDLAVDPRDGRLYALTEPLGYVSDDGGASWRSLPPPVLARGSFRAIAVGATETTLCVSNGLSGNGVLRSLDRGTSWILANAGLPGTSIEALKAAPSVPGTFYVVANGSLCRSTDDAVSWQVRSALPGSGLRFLAVSPVNADLVYLAMNNGAWRSTDGGASWARLDDPSDPSRVEFIVEGARVLGAARGRLFTMSLDGERLEPGAAFLHTRVNAACARTGGGVLLGAEAGIFAGGADVFLGAGRPALSSTGISAVDASAIAFAQGSPVLYVATGLGGETGLGYEAGVFRSPDGGATWELRSEGITNLDLRSIAVAPSDPDVVYAGSVEALSENGGNGRIFRTVDGGLTWTDVTAGIDHDEPHIIISILVHPADPDVVWASVQGLHGGIYHTTDGGGTWERRAQGLESMPPQPNGEWSEFENYFAMLSQVMDPRNSRRIFVGGGGCWGGVYVTEDSGLTWLRRAEGAMEADLTVKNPPGDDPIFGIHLELFDIDIDPRNPDRLVASGGRGRYPEGNPQWGIVFESTDGGATWSILREGNRGNLVDYFTSPVTGVALHPFDGKRLYVATRDGIKTSGTGGTAGSWIAMNEGFGKRERFTRTIGMDPDDPTRLYVATALGGVWVRDLDVTPVRLLASEAAWDPERGVVLRWSVADAADHAGFLVERLNTDGVPEGRVTPSLVSGHASYEIVDPAPAFGRTNRYRLVEVDRAGTGTEIARMEVLVPRAPVLTLGPARPNPAGRNGARMSLGLAAAGRLSVRVFDAAGALVATLRDGPAGPGIHEIAWNPAASVSEKQAAGVYLIVAEANGERATRKVLMLP